MEKMEADAQADRATNDPYSDANIEADSKVLFSPLGGAYNPFNANAPINGDETA